MIVNWRKYRWRMDRIITQMFLKREMSKVIEMLDEPEPILVTKRGKPLFIIVPYPASDDL